MEQVELTMKQLIKVLVIFIMCTATQALAFGEQEFVISKDVDVHVFQQKASGDMLLLWLPSESGLLEQEKKTAAALARQGIEVWFADLLGAWFLSPMASSIASLPANDVAVLIEKIRKQTGKKIILVANGRGALIVLRAARAWQQNFGQQHRLGGVILLSPKLFVETPEPGEAGKMMPVASKTNLPVLLLQPANSPWRWKLDQIVSSLEQSGSDVYIRVLAESRDRFYYRPDATKKEDAMAARLPALLGSAVRLLQSYNTKTRQVSGKLSTVRKLPGKKPRNLRKYTGDSRPSALTLYDLTDKQHSLEQYRGKVVLVNFWASWCPPCVHEMPSMQRLKEKFKGKPFEILAVNMAENKATIMQFLKTKVQVDFTILQDSDGSALKRWKVFAFPTSYVIGKKGKIRRALFGSIDWMNTDVVGKIDMLVNE